MPKDNIPKEVEPLKKQKDIKKIKQFLYGKQNKRDYMMFVVGINVGLRIGDLLSLKIKDVVDEKGRIKSSVIIQEQKTKKWREFEVNESAKKAIEIYLGSKAEYSMDDYLFQSRKGSGPIRTRSAHKIIKNTMRELGIKGNFGTHSLRKSFGYHRYIAGVNLETLQKIFNHESPAVTLRYIGITKEVISDAYNSVNL